MFQSKKKKFSSDALVFRKVQEEWRHLQGTRGVERYNRELEQSTELFEKAIGQRDFRKLFELEKLAMERDRQMAHDRGMAYKPRPDPWGAMDALENLWDASGDRRVFAKSHKTALTAYPDGDAPFDQFALQVRQLKRQVGVYAEGEVNAVQNRHHTVRKTALDTLAAEYSLRVKRMLKKLDKGLSR